MLHSEIHGTHQPNEGQGLTIQDLLNLLMKIPSKARQNYLMDANGNDVTGLRFSKSDQSDKWEYNVFLKVSD